MERRLAAVLIADVAGYGRLSQADEEGTRARFQADLHEVFEPKIAAHHGRLVKTMGDGLLVEFHSVVNALRCAIEIQHIEAARNVDIPLDRRLKFRIGINLGDVIVEGDDIQGDGVNIAHRLQGLADEGGIALSAAAHEQVKNKLDIGFEFLGEQRLKNIAEPVRAYRVIMDSAVVGEMIRGRKIVGPSRRRSAVVAAAIVLLLAGGALAWRSPWRSTIEPASTERMALPLPEKPSVAVLPFANLSNDPQQAYFADGLAEDMMTGLSRLPGLFVIARHSAFAYKDQELDLRKVGRELGVHYIVEGSVQRTGEQVRINIQLVDVSTLGHIWAEKYDGSMAEIFVLQDRVTKSVVDALALKLTAGEQQVLANQNETAVPEAYDEFLRGWEHFQRTTPADFVAAIPHFERALALDPAYARAQAALAMVYFRAYDQGWTTSLGMTADAAFRKAREYLNLANAHPTTTSHQVAGNISRDRGWYDDAVKEFRAAIALDPSDSWSYAYLAYSLIYAGKAAEGEKQIETAMRLDPHFPSLFDFYLGLAQFEQNRMEQAAITLEKAVRLNPDDPWPFLFLAASYSYLERKDEATETIAAFNSARVKAGGVPLVMSELTGRYDLKSFAPREGSPLLEGLLRLGIPNDFYAPTFDPLRLKAREVEALFFGHRLHGRTWNGWEYGLSVAADGTAVAFGNWGVGPGTGANTAQLEGDRLCFLLSTTRMCGSVLRNPGGTRTKENEYVWFVGGFVRPFSQIE
jgi:TolB-like protein/class 3 adenylate cyclase/Flp pilus assembly protein TadD